MAAGSADPWRKVLTQLVGWINDPLEWSLTSPWGMRLLGAENGMGQLRDGIPSCLSLLQCTGWSWYLSGSVWVLMQSSPLMKSPGVERVRNRAAGIWESCDTLCSQPLGAVSLPCPGFTAFLNFGSCSSGFCNQNVMNDLTFYICSEQVFVECALWNFPGVGGSVPGSGVHGTGLGAPGRLWGHGWQMLLHF